MYSWLDAKGHVLQPAALPRAGYGLFESQEITNNMVKTAQAVHSLLQQFSASAPWKLTVPNLILLRFCPQIH